MQHTTFRFPTRAGLIVATIFCAVTCFSAIPASADHHLSKEKKQAVSESNRVLRHAVFFSFKDSASESEIQSVVDAFGELPKKIDTIVDYEWGVNTSASNHDGFTHCFLVTFADEKGRDVYLPHPAHAKEFVSVLVPHMKDVFVVDFWSSPGEMDLKKKFRHMAFLKFKDDASPEGIKKVEDGFDALAGIDLVKGYEGGINNSPESHDDGFTHCYIITFASDAALVDYAPHEIHQALVSVLPPVMEKLRILDYWAK